MTEKGYRIIAALQDNEKMKKFIHRLVQKEARYVKDVAELNGMVPFYSGVEGVQSLDALKHELRSADWVADGEGRNAPLSETGYKSVASRKSKPHMLAFARRILDARGLKCADEGALTGLMAYFDGEIAVQSFDALSKELVSAPWASPRAAAAEAEAAPQLLQLGAALDAPSGNIEDSVPTTEKGYQTVAALKDNQKMKTFIHRVVEKEARYIKDPAELSGLVPFYSGVEGVKTLNALKQELRSAAWVADGEGRNAPLSEIGYQRVAVRKSKPHMLAFARRILDARGLKCADEGALIGLMT